MKDYRSNSLKPSSQRKGAKESKIPISVSCGKEQSRVWMQERKSSRAGSSHSSGVMAAVRSFHGGAQTKQGNIASHNPQKASFYCPISSSAVTSNHCCHVTAVREQPSRRLLAIHLFRGINTGGVHREVITNMI